MKQCPKCQSPDIHQSRSRSKWERWRKEITGKRPYRCRACGWRGWGIETPAKFSDAEIQLALEACFAEPPALAPDSSDRREWELNLDRPEAIDRPRGGRG